MHEVKVVPDGPGGYSYKIELNDYHLASSKNILPDTFVESVQVSMMDGNAAPKAFLDIFNSELIRSAYKIKKSLDPSLFNLHHRMPLIFAHLMLYLGWMEDPSCGHPSWSFLETLLILLELALLQKVW